ncbi:transposase [Psychrobacter sp. 5A.1]|uniref:transposase n=1 Tax=Psychrobacter sp. 5A.1 TaxID=3035207 RepID=UPI0025B5AC05|nr:transposase [Psychrobacter sp. 5A.1]MDN3503563.1 transposase [Psychrobacter sp. 5A.1]
MHQFEDQDRPIIYLDESGFKSHDNRPHGYCYKGQKCFSEYNWQLKNQTNAIRNNQLFAVGLYDCSIDSNLFHSWVTQLLVPELPKNSVIVMDMSEDKAKHCFARAQGESCARVQPSTNGLIPKCSGIINLDSC